MARLSSVGLISKITVLNVSINRQDVIVFVEQSDNITDVSIQRGQSPFDPSTSSSQSSRLSRMSCFRADKSIAKRLLSTCLVYMSHCCRSLFLPLTNIELSSHVNDGGSSSLSMFNSIGQCVSFCHQGTVGTRRILVELQLKGCISILSAFNVLPGASAEMHACCDLNF